MKSRVYLAIDLGASSGRVMAALYDGRQLKLEEVHRFHNGGCRMPDGWHWSIVGLFSEIKQGLAKAAALHGRSLVSAGVDTWGVDYGLVDRHGRLLGMPFMYRDGRTDGVPERIFKRVSRASIYGVTGIQTMFFNTLFQFYAEQQSKSPLLEAAHRLLFIPDLLHYWLSGRMANEYTIASTSQMLDARRRTWARGLLKQLELPDRLLGDVVQPGTVLGDVQKVFRDELGLPKLRIVAPGSHDTASAVAAVPAEGDRHAYLSSGTWSLMGLELQKPMLTEQAAALNFTNEGGVCDTIRFLKNICGLWLVQESRRIWNQAGPEIGFDALRAEAMAATPMTCLINPDHADFSTPGDMPARIAAFCRRTRQKAPATRGAVMRTIYESLALRYRDVLGKLEQLSGRSLDVLHIVGGGVRDTTLNQFTADALQRPVVAGPVEATALGNVLVQMIASGDLASLEEGRALVRRSFPTRTFEPGDAAPWQAAYGRFQELESA